HCAWEYGCECRDCRGRARHYRLARRLCPIGGGRIDYHYFGGLRGVAKNLGRARAGNVGLAARAPHALAAQSRAASAAVRANAEQLALKSTRANREATDSRD